MPELLNVLANTPVPMVLVIAGIFFLFLAIGGQFGAKIITDQVKQKFAGLLGVVLLLAGLGFYLIPNPSGGQLAPSPSPVAPPPSPQQGVLSPAIAPSGNGEVSSPMTVRLEAVKYDAAEGHLNRDQRSIEGVYLSYINSGEWIRFDMLDLGDRKRSTFHARVASATNGGIIKVRLDKPDGEIAASCKVHNTGDWLKWETVDCALKQPLLGKHTMYFVFEGSDNYLFNINWMEFRS